MSVRAKFMLKEICSRGYSYVSTSGRVTTPEPTRLVFENQYDDRIPEDRRFEKATPTGGRIEMFCDNQSALAQFQIGHQYYVDFVSADEPA